MCGRYTLRTPWLRVAEHFGLRVTDLPELFVRRFNVGPTQQVLTVRQDAEGQRRRREVGLHSVLVLTAR